MNVGDSSKTVDLTPGTTSGVLYAGMSADGSEVFFTTKDRLLSEDEDESADLYVASISGESATVSLLSRGSEGTGNTDVCDPAANSAHQHWNSKGAEANCGVVAIGGGGGVASQEGSAYFLSPELLDGPSNGTQDAPNLYLAHAGEAPRYVTTLESALNLPHPPSLKRSFDHSFGSFDTAAGLAVDHSDGSVYVINAPTEAQAEAGAKAYVEKFDSSGNLVASFGDTTPAHNGKLAGSETPAGSFAPNTNFPPGQLAVDNDPDSPSYRDLYVPDFGNGVVDKFGPEGEYKGQIEASLANGVAVDSATGNLYVSQIFSFTHGSAYVSVFTPQGVEVAGAGFRVIALTPDAIAVDPATKFVYLDQGGGEEAEVELYTPAGLALRVIDPNAAHSLSIDPATGDLYADEGNQVARYDASGNRLGTIGSGALHGSGGVAIDPEGNLYASNGAGIAAFTPSLAADPRVDNPAVVDAVSEPSARRTADFQVTPDGSYAAFDSTLALGGGEEDTAGHSEVYRYRSGDGNLECVSCTSTGAASAGDSSLAQNGLSLLADGRVFFDSTDQLVAADTDGKRDAYEFADPGAGNCSTASPAYATATGSCIALISAGTSPFDSGLLTATANGKDAFIFTRDSLAPQDENGPTMKIYDAREGGGFPFLLPQAGCRASDECHGAASPPPPPIQSGTESGTPHNVEVHPKPGKCGKGKVRHHGACVKKPRKPHHHKHQKRGRQ
jgi:sugar lactone lactonase YvrE